jgi:hypothetical protein
MKPTRSDQILRVVIPLTLRRKNGRPKILPPADCQPLKARSQDRHILRVIGRAWAWRRRMEAGEFTTIQDLADHVDLSDRHVSKTLRLAYLAPGVLEILLIKRTPPAVSLVRLVEIASLPWVEQAAEVFAAKC